MMTRQQFIRIGAALGVSPLAACTTTAPGESYQTAVIKVWRPMTGVLEGDLAVKRELVRCATLAPSGHNSQCWKFRIAGNSIAILPDLTRRTPVVDPDDHHLFVSLGCALENMAQASLAYGLNSQATFDVSSNALNVGFETIKASSSPLHQAIFRRQSTHEMYDAQALSAADLKLLENAGTGSGIRIVMFTAKPDVEKILDLVLQGNTAQLGDANFVKELKHSLRFGASEAVKTGDGLYSITSGNPSLPRWLGSPMFDILVSAKSENDKYAEQTRSSAGIAIFISAVDDKAHWIEAGRCYEGFALQATTMDIRHAMLNQAVEVPAVRKALADLLKLEGGRPDLVVRFGRGALMPSSLRRPLEDVLI